jgi:collagen type I/II/III/V/XI/XXIV/XXVII alpha
MATIIVSSGVISGGLTITSGNTLDVLSGGTAVDTTVARGAVDIVNQGGVTSATILSGGSEFGDGGVISGTTILAGGVEYLGEGSAVGVVIGSGGVQYVEGGRAISTTVSFGGFQAISGLASATTIDSGGFAVVSNGEELLSATISGGGDVIAAPQGQVMSPTVLPGGTIVSTGVALIEPGSATLYATVASGLSLNQASFEYVLAGGTALDTTIDGGQYVFAGGHVSDTTVGSEGVAFVFSGAVINGTTLAGANSVLIATDGSAIGTVVDSGAFAYLTGSTATATRVNSGGYEIVSRASTDSGSVIAVGGSEDVQSAGSAQDETIAGTLVLSSDATGSDITITPAGIIEMASASTLAGSIVFAGGSATLELLSSTTPQAVLSGFGPQDAIDLAALPYVSGGVAGIVSGTTEELVVSQGGMTYSFGVTGDYAPATFDLSQDGTGTVVTVTGIPCFAGGTRIATTRGLIPVERLAVGDHVVTVEDEPLPILWIGRRLVDCRRHPRPKAILPVRIAADAFGPGQPARDLILSPDHAIYAEGVLIPVKYLITGGAVRQMAVASVTYYHVELARHAVLLAENLPAESYLDTGDRSAFADEGVAMSLYPEFGAERLDVAMIQEAAGCAPLQVTGPAVERVRASLLSRDASKGRMELNRPSVGG